MKRKHTEIEKETFPKSCDLCEEDLESVQEMKLHMKKHSYKRVDYKCEECDFCGKNDVTMEVHVGKVHSEMFECGLCDSVFNDLDGLELHLCTCEVYKCQCCAKFKTLAQIKAHIEEKHEAESMIRMQHQKLNRNNQEEVSSQSYWTNDIFDEEETDSEIEK